MFKTLFVASLPVLAVLAQVDPSEPAPGDNFKEGGDCSISWGVDPTGKWTELNIQLMTGSNQAMQHLTTVATVDGTKVSQFTYTCPEMTVHSPIYFYQFSSPAAPTNLTWTGRFSISGADGTVTPPTETTDGVAWGTGALKDASSAKPAPSYLSGLASSGGANSTAVADSPLTATTLSASPPSATSGSGSGSGASAASGLTPSRSVAPADGAVTTTIGGTTGAAQVSQTQNANGAAALAIDFRTRGVQALAGLAGTAIVFATLF